MSVRSWCESAGMKGGYVRSCGESAGMKGGYVRQELW